MSKRRVGRQRALQLLYALEFRSVSFEEAEEEFLSVNRKRRQGWSDFAHELALKAWSERADLDREISAALTNWKIERLLRMDRLCLRMAVAELRYFPDVPLRVTLDEYIELARLFGEDESPRFINGVLDRIAREYKHKEKAATAAGAAEEAAAPVSDADVDELSENEERSE